MTPSAAGRALLAWLAEAGSAAEIALFDGAGPGTATALEAIRRHLPGIDASGLTPRPSTRDELLGDWYDEAIGGLRRRGDWRLADGGRAVDPPLGTLDDWPKGGSYSHGDRGRTGRAIGLGYAVSCPVYGLSVPPRAVDRAFGELVGLVAPCGEDVAILDWTGPALRGAHPHFDAGFEWWGVMLATVHRPGIGRIAVISASDTD